MVGRARELDRLLDAFAQASENRSCQLFTILGAAGVGKSRLAYEFLHDLDARVVRGRCLSYGEGITYWPVVEVVKQLDALPANEAAAAALLSLLGQSDEGTTAEEIGWAFRKLLEEQAQKRPLVCVFDDIHWAEETFLELVGHVADLARDAPILLLCMARPELLDNQPGWGGGKLNATTLLLEPLSGEETDSLLDSLGGIDERLRERIRTASEGNPLFVEEMLALVRESKQRDVRVPPTIQALLAARLDQLESAERHVLERGSVEGRVFHQGAVRALSDGDGQVSQRLLALVRKELVRPNRSQLPGDDAFRFRHLLIRDAAYDALPKAVRADLHERFADWLEERAPDLVELDEILGYHLEQAARYKQELGQADPTLAKRAGERLTVSGRRALWRGDSRAAERLLERALGLTRPARLDVVLELDLAQAHFERDAAKAAAIADAAAERARAAGDETGELLGRVGAAYHRSFVAADPAVDELERLARKALPPLVQAGNHAGLVHVWYALSFGVANFRGRFEDCAHAAEQALRHARLAGQHNSHLFRLDHALTSGPRPADEALRTLDALLPENPHPRLLLERAWLLSMLARFDESARSAREAGERGRELTGDDWVEVYLARIAATAGRHEDAAAHLRRFCDLLEARGLRAYLSTYAPLRGRSLCALGRHDEAECLAQLGRELGDEQDASTQALWRQVQALVNAHRGQHTQAEQLAREAVAISERTDALNNQGDAFCDLAEVLAAAGRSNDAFQALEQALDRYERKKNLAMFAQVRPKLEALRDSVPR